jgi:hypothetical protein
MKGSFPGIVFITGLTALISLNSCASDPPQQVGFEECLYGAPESIFNPGIPGISRHQFELQPDRGIERFVLNQETSVEIEQTGCDHIRQKFTFSWKPEASIRSHSEWAAHAIRIYQELGELGAPYLSFSAISEVLQTKQKKLSPESKPVTLQPGLQFRIITAEVNQQAILITELYQKPPEIE